MTIIRNSFVGQHGIKCPQKALHFPCLVLVDSIWTHPSKTIFPERIGSVHSGLFLPSDSATKLGAVRGLRKVEVLDKYVHMNFESVVAAAQRNFGPDLQCCTLLTVDIDSLLEIWYGEWRIYINFNFWMPVQENGHSGFSIMRGIQE